MNDIPYIYSQLAISLCELPRVGDAAARLHEGVQYVLSSPGKHLRGRLLLSIVSDLAGSEAAERALPAAVAVELFHAASLIHDDLPALDDDDMRRGKPACHKAFGEATAILTGDYLIAAAFERLTKVSGLGVEFSELTRRYASTWMMLCAGQQLDIEGSLDEVVREKMTEMKTGALFACAAAAGAILGGKSSHTDSFERWGVRLGVLFQRIDDVLDSERDRSEIELVQRDSEDIEAELSELIGEECALSTKAVRAVLSVELLGK